MSAFDDSTELATGLWELGKRLEAVEVDDSTNSYLACEGSLHIASLYTAFLHTRKENVRLRAQLLLTRKAFNENT